MAEPLKYMYNPAFFDKLCPMLRQSIPGFDCRQFIFRVFDNRWPELELKERVRHIACALHDFLPNEFPMAARMLGDLSVSILENDAMPAQSFAMIFLADYVEVFGLDHPEESLEALEKITQLVSAEFAIRPFLIRYREMTMKKMLAWSKHSQASVRRLSSEGCRPRLPWGMGLPFFKNDPAPILSVLENLKDDPSEYVRKSVANNLNDIAKDHPAIVLRLATKWRGLSGNTDWILRHGCRTLLKRGDEKALSLQGFDHRSRGKVKTFRLHGRKVKIGDDLKFYFQFVNEEEKSRRFRLDYAIDYVTRSGKVSRKIFKITENRFAPGDPVTIHRRQSFRDLTTRKHCRGKHQLTILGNGKKLAAAEFVVC